jgi:hypothetical protein
VSLFKPSLEALKRPYSAYWQGLFSGTGRERMPLDERQRPHFRPEYELRPMASKHGGVSSSPTRNLTVRFILCASGAGAVEQHSGPGAEPRGVDGGRGRRTAARRGAAGRTVGRRGLAAGATHGQPVLAPLPGEREGDRERERERQRETERELGARWGAVASLLAPRTDNQCWRRYQVRERERERERERGRQRGGEGRGVRLTREVGTPLPSNSPHDHMIELPNTRCSLFATG